MNKGLNDSHSYSVVGVLDEFGAEGGWFPEYDEWLTGIFTS